MQGVLLHFKADLKPLDPLRTIFVQPCLATEEVLLGLLDRPGVEGAMTLDFGHVLLRPYLVVAKTDMFEV